MRVNYFETIRLYEGFEPKVSGFIDDRIRSSVLLHLGKSVGDLGNYISSNYITTNRVFNLSDQSQIRGLNPGIAKGKLVVAETTDGGEIVADNIYVFLYSSCRFKAGCRNTYSF